jgi:cysteine desulfurase
MIYLDNNATTKVCDEAKNAMTTWIQSCSNPSSASKIAEAGKILIDKFKQQICNVCNINEKTYEIVITSGATESNCCLIRMTVDAWYRMFPDKKPHIITSTIEHKSIMECLHQLDEIDHKVDVTYINPNIYGIIDPQVVEQAIQQNTILITIMFANNELGSINPITKISQVAHKHNIPFHSDTVQLFGKIPIDMPKFGIDALSMSFHKLYGPQGIGLLILKRKFIDGYKLRGIINGTQQNGLRGGTESVNNIAGAAAALSCNFNNRDRKNRHLMQLRNHLIDGLKKIAPVINYADAISTKNNKSEPIKFTILGHPKDVLPNTVLLCVLRYDKDFCNVKLKHTLENDYGIIVSIGSACNTSNKKASHIMDAIKATPIIKRGVIRISFADDTSQNDIDKFIISMKKIISNPDKVSF